MFCNQLRENRRKLGLTQAALGRAAGVSGSAIGMYEQGRRLPGPAAEARLRRFFAGHQMELPKLPDQPEGREGFWEELRRAAAVAPYTGLRPHASGESW